jgi:hypothetical protein
VGAETLAAGIAQRVEGQGKCHGVTKDGFEIDICSRQLIGLVRQLVAGLDEELAKLERYVERHRARAAGAVRTSGAPHTTGDEHSFDDALSAQLRFHRLVAETRQCHPGIRDRCCHDDFPPQTGLAEDVVDRDD